jgi:hypothetical protein
LKLYLKIEHAYGRQLTHKTVILKISRTISFMLIKQKYIKGILRDSYIMLQFYFSISNLEIKTKQLFLFRFFYKYSNMLFIQFIKLVDCHNSKGTIYIY